MSLTENLSWSGRTLNRSFVRRRIPVLLLCLLFAGCSATRIVYNHLDWILVWTIGDFFTLDDEQEDWLKAAVRRNIEWHRRDQLPKYAQLLRGIEQDTSSGTVTPDRLEEFYARFIVLWDGFIVHVTPDITAFFRMLSQAQIDEFIDNLEESNRKLWKKYAGTTPRDRRRKRQDAAIKWLERAVGHLSDEQKALVRSYLASLHDVSSDWMTGRRQWQQDFRSLVIKRPPEPEFSNRMMHLLLEPDRHDSSEYRRLVAENRRTVMAMIAALNNALTDRQRNRLIERLKKFARNFEILATQKT